MKTEILILEFNAESSYDGEIEVLYASGWKIKAMATTGETAEKYGLITFALEREVPDETL